MPYIQRHMGGLADSGGSLGMAVKKKHANQAQRVKMLKEQKRAQVTALLTALLTAPFGSLTPESRQTPAGLGVGRSRRVTHGGSLTAGRSPTYGCPTAVQRLFNGANGSPTALQRLSLCLSQEERDHTAHSL